MLKIPIVCKMVDWSKERNSVYPVKIYNRFFPSLQLLGTRKGSRAIPQHTGRPYSHAWSSKGEQPGMGSSSSTTYYRLVFIIDGGLFFTSSRSFLLWLWRIFMVGESCERLGRHMRNFLVCMSSLRQLLVPVHTMGVPSLAGSSFYTHQ